MSKVHPSTTLPGGVVDTNGTVVQHGDDARRACRVMVVDSNGTIIDDFTGSGGPGSGGLTDAELRASPVPVSGTVTATTGGLTDTQLRATPVPVSGTVTATTGGLTDTQLRATPVPVSGTVTATTGGLTDTQLRASAVPVSAGTNLNTSLLALEAGGNLAAILTELGQKTEPANQQHTIIDSGSVTVAGAVTATGPADSVGTPTDITGSSQSVTVTMAGYTGVSFQITGTWTGFIWATVSQDGGTTYSSQPVPCFNYNTSAVQGAFTANAMAAPLVASGITHFRIQSTAGAWTGTATIVITRTGIAVNGAAAYASTGTTPSFIAQVGGPLGSVPTIMFPAYVANAVPTSAYNGWVVRQVPEYSSRSDTYTGIANGTAVNVSTHTRQYFSLQVKCTTAPALSWDVVLEGSLDGTNYDTILEHTQATGDGKILWSTVSTPCLYFRSRCVNAFLGDSTAVVATILGRY